MRIFLTGCSGFIGAAVAQALLSASYEVVGAVRQLPSSTSLVGDALLWQEIGSINGQTAWSQTFQSVDTVVHCAARAHVMREPAVDSFEAYRKVNFQGTLRMAQKAAEAGVQRFLFLSSVKANGESTVTDLPYNELSPIAPEGAYGQSKADAEQALLALAAQTDMEVVIIRPPLVYGPGVKGNFANMIKWVQSGVPLPFGAVYNQRSLVALGNLVSLIILCADTNRSPQAANQVFMVADDEDVSTTKLLQKVAQAAGRPSRLFPVPTYLLRVGTAFTRKHGAANPLLDNLLVDASKARMILGWRPVINMDQQLATLFQNHD